MTHLPPPRNRSYGTPATPPRTIQHPTNSLKTLPSPPPSPHPPPVLKPKCTADPLTRPAPFRSALRRWFEQHGKDYPWRRTRDPYAILVSEVMLQQTQITTVLGRGFYTRFLTSFPDTATLAAAPDDPLLKAWEGLGYYRRARMLRDAARSIQNDHAGRFPSDFQAILALPGVGRYTAGAVFSFAFEKPAPIVDGNVARVLTRLFDFHGEINQPAGQKPLWAWAETLLDPKHPRAFNSALMELGQTHCRTGQPDCLSCPVARFCRATDPASLPRKSPARKSEAVDEHTLFATRGDQILLHKLPAGRRTGMWRLPERSPAETAALALLHQRKYAITRYRVTLHVHRASRVKARENELWHPIDDLESLVIPPADRAAIQAILDSTKEIP